MGDSWIWYIKRSGAVEQLRVHVRNLSMLGVNGATNSKGRVELFERGYGKDAAGIAREAISYGQCHNLSDGTTMFISSHSLPFHLRSVIFDGIRKR